MITKRLVSVVLTVRGGDKYLPGAIQTVCLQRYRPLELVLVDDGIDWRKVSEESIQDECRKSGIGLLILKQNGQGRARALNSGVASANGSVIAVLDVDDRWHRDKLTLQVEVLEKTGGVVGTSIQMMFGGVDAEETFSWERGLSGTILDVTPEIARHCPLTHSSVLVDKATLKSFGGYDQRRGAQLDWEIMFRAVQAGERLYRMEARLTAKRLHEEQSFEASRKLWYLWSSILLQVSIQRRLGLSIWHRYFILRRSLIWLMPRKLKWWIIRQVGKDQ